MDGETPPIPSVKRGRKSRASKTKQQSADLIQTSSPLGRTNDSFESSEPGSSTVGFLANADEDNTPSSATSCSSIKSNDNLLMPPPSQPDNLSSSPLHDVQLVNEEPQDHELIVDGFSIFCFGSEDEVKAAAEATGNSYTNKRIDHILENGPVNSPRAPKLPSRNTNSPTGSKRIKKVKEPKTPRSNKKDLKKSPLVANSSRRSPLVSSAPNGTLTAASTSTELPLQTTTCNAFDVKKEKCEKKYGDIKLLSDAVCKPLGLFKAEDAPPDNYKIKSENFKAASSLHQSEESTSIKQENNDIKEGKRPLTESSTTHLIQAPPLKPCQPTAASKQELCLDETPGNRLAENSLRFNSGQSTSSPFTQGDQPLRTESSGSEPVQYTASAAAIVPITSTPSAALVAANTVSTPSINSRSNSVHSIASSNSRRTTPVCTGSVSSRDNSSIRTASRGSDRNTSRGSQQPATSTADLYPSPLLAQNSFGQVNPNMLSFGATNGLTPPFSYPPAASFNQPPPNFPFGTDILSSFPHNASLPANNDEALRADALRRMMGSERPGMPPFLRPELLFPPSSGMGNTPLASNIHGAMLMQQMLEKLPKMDQFQQLLYNQQRNAAAASSSAPAGIPGAPVIGPSPFQSVPGGHTTSSTSPHNAQKKSGKWCSAHVRIAYQIYNASRSQPPRTEENKNGVVNSNSGASSVSDKQAVQPLGHSINSITSNVHKPKDVPASTQSHPKPSPVASPNISSPLHRTDSSRLTNSNPGSPAHFMPSSTTARTTPKETLSASAPGRSLHNGALSIPSPRDIQWCRTPPSQPNPSPSSAPTTSSRRVRDDRDMRKPNGSSSGHGKRPSSASSQQVHKKRRSRSRSPGKLSRNKYPMQRQSNGHAVDKDKALTSSLPAVSRQQLYGAPLLPGLINSDNKTTNGVAPPPHQDFWAFMHQQRGLESQTGRYNMVQMNSAVAMGINDHDRNEKERAALQLLERAKVQNTLCNPALAGLNGFHQANSLTGLGVPPPLIPTSHHSSHSQPSNTGTDSYHR